MTTKLIGALIIVLVLFGGWNLFLYWEKVKNDEDLKRKEAVVISGNSQHLEGVPATLEPGLQKAHQAGAEALGAWLKTYGGSIKDPRKAWLELEYAMLLSRENPAEAKRVYAGVADRTLETSPVYQRVKQLEKTYR
jgi:hypothetical protein